VLPLLILSYHSPSSFLFCSASLSLSDLPCNCWFCLAPCPLSSSLCLSKLNISQHRGFPFISLLSLSLSLAALLTSMPPHRPPSWNPSHSLAPPNNCNCEVAVCCQCQGWFQSSPSEFYPPSLSLSLSLSPISHNVAAAGQNYAAVDNGRQPLYRRRVNSTSEVQTITTPEGEA
jgi:hypothetical protein